MESYLYKKVMNEHYDKFQRPPGVENVGKELKIVVLCIIANEI